MSWVLRSSKSPIHPSILRPWRNCKSRLGLLLLHHPSIHLLYSALLKHSLDHILTDNTQTITIKSNSIPNFSLSSRLLNNNSFPCFSFLNHKNKIKKRPTLSPLLSRYSLKTAKPQAPKSTTTTTQIIQNAVPTPPRLPHHHPRRIQHLFLGRQRSSPRPASSLGLGRRRRDRSRRC